MSGVVDVRDQGRDVIVTWEGLTKSSYSSRFFFIFTEECSLRMKFHLKKEAGREMLKFYITRDDEDMNVTAQVDVKKQNGESIGYLPNFSGSLSIMQTRELRVIVRSLKITRKVKPPVVPDLTPALKDDTYSDCILVCGEETFKAHKLILATRSSVFRAMFDSDMIEGRESRVVVKDLEVPVVKGMLKYLYSNQVEEEISSGLLEAAEKYDLQGLKSACEGILKKSITKANAVDILNMADLFRAEELKKASIQFFIENRNDMEINLKSLSAKLNPELLERVFQAFVKN